MLVYVLSKNGQPLMPTHRYGFVRRLLNSQKAKVIRRCPFTIQLQYDTSCKKLKLLEASKGYLTERRNAFLSPLNSV